FHVRFSKQGTAESFNFWRRSGSGSWVISGDWVASRQTSLSGAGRSSFAQCRQSLTDYLTIAGFKMSQREALTQITLSLLEIEGKYLLVAEEMRVGGCEAIMWVAVFVAQLNPFWAGIGRIEARVTKYLCLGGLLAPQSRQSIILL